MMTVAAKPAPADAEALANDPTRILTTAETPDLDADGRLWVVLWQNIETGEFDGLQWRAGLNPHSVVNLLIDALTRARIVENGGILAAYTELAEAREALTEKPATARRKGGKR